MIITPSWPAPKNVQAFTTVRTMGNMATHVEDDPATVEKNRLRLLTDTPLSESPRWLNQIHSNTVIKMDASTRLTSPEADGSYTHVPGIVCAVLTADC
ncbi:MAG TPA: laccase domain-containing protein, partial [Gammaproteobacteria bacterium]|nr:laccase domain-containing protein [Gammaproteobacteria bacterium]